MGSLKPFNREELITSDLDFIQSTKTDEIAFRFKDGVLTPGILPPATTIPVDISNGCTAAFPINLNASNTIDVGDLGPASTIHVAYDSNGDRIAIPQNDNVTFNKYAYKFTTTGISGNSTPFSTGRRGISARIPSTGQATRYVFISSLSVVKTVSMLSGTPPDHSFPTATVGTVITPDGDTKRAISNIDQKSGFSYAHQFVDGYRIFVAVGPDDPDYGIAGSNTPEVTISGATVTLTNPLINGYVDAYDNPSRAIYLGNFIIHSNGVIDAPSLDYSGRPILKFRAIEATTVGANPTVSYSLGDIRTVLEHMNGIGTGTISAKNTHGLSIADIISGSLEPTLGLFQDETMGDGIADNTAGISPYNNPKSSSALLPVPNTAIANNLASPVINITMAQPTGSGVSNFSGPIVHAVLINQLTATQSFYIAGNRINGATVNAIVTSHANVGGRGVIPFTSDAIGTYDIFICPNYSVGAAIGTALLGKALTGTTLDNGRVIIARVYWDGVNLHESLENSASATVGPVQDLRPLGIINTKSISSKALQDPNEGLLTTTVFSNVVANPEFRLATNPNAVMKYATNSPLNSKIAVTSGLSIEITQTTGSLDFGNPSDAYGTFEMTPSASAFDMAIIQKLNGIPLKTNAVYTVSAQVRINGGNVVPNNNRFGIQMDLVDWALITSYTGGAAVNFHPTRDNSWQKIAASFKMTQVGTPSNAGALKIRLFAGTPDGIPLYSSTPHPTIDITQICIVEGNWTTGFVGPRTYSGEIFMWDKSTSCPPGSEEVTSLQGRMPLGKNSSGPTTVGGTYSAGNSQTAPIVSATATDGSHGHIANTKWWTNGGNGSIGKGIAGADYNYRVYIDAEGSSNHAHAITQNISQYIVLFCRRL